MAAAIGSGAISAKTPAAVATPFPQTFQSRKIDRTCPAMAATPAAVTRSVAASPEEISRWMATRGALAEIERVVVVPYLGSRPDLTGIAGAVHWQDWTAVVLMMVAIGSVLWPARSARAAK